MFRTDLVVDTATPNAKVQNCQVIVHSKQKNLQFYAEEIATIFQN